jgi:hypothetical protein
LEITLKVIGNALVCSSSAKISSRNADSSCGSSSFGRQERASAMILRLLKSRQFWDRIPQQSIASE